MYTCGVRHIEAQEAGGLRDDSGPQAVGGLRDDRGPRAAGGLRERSKARRQDALIRAALELFADRGYDATTIADIAAAAEVAPRTVAMYFPSKQDIAMWRFGQSVDELTSLLRDGQGESGTAILTRWLRGGAWAAEEVKALSARMFAANPELNALRTARMAEAIAEGAARIADDTGAAPADPMPRLAAVATAAIMIELTDIPPGPRRDQAVAAAMRFLEAGLATIGPGAPPPPPG
jgi:AcrR family transcriptional regulator